MDAELPRKYVPMHEEMIDRVRTRYGDHYDPGFFVPLSGGLDSSTVLTFACQYADRVGWDRNDVHSTFCYRKNMYPAEEEDMGYAEKLADELGISLHLIDISPLIEGLEHMISYSGEALLDDDRICRSRALTSRTFEEKLGKLSFDTGNFSEFLLGQWATGAYTGQIDFINNLFKTEVRELAERISVPQYIISRTKRSSELRNGAVVENYDPVDPILFLFLLGKTPEQVAKIRGEDVESVRWIVNRAQNIMIRAYSGDPVVEISGTYLDPRNYYASKKQINPLVEQLHQLRLKRWDG
ncbi:MAG: hypothetical protein HY832_03670 [Candidatus Aenigmarchaeota archaeon]|nr:hypothetical protein [Candidatus Aenigmarchaeota archaeon]